MTADQFSYWLQGFCELNCEVPTAEQWQSIREHLSTVFTKITPQIGVVDLANAIRQPAVRDAQPVRLC